MNRCLIVGLALCGCFSSAVQSNVASAGEPGDTMPQVNAVDLHAGRARIIGYLGHPLGEVVTVRGIWYAPPESAKISSPIYRVTHINGEPVESPIDITRYRFRPTSTEGRSGQSDKDRWDWIAHWNGKLNAPNFKAGEGWEFSGVENCSMRVSVSIWDERGPIMAEPLDYGVNGFLTTFDFIRARRIPTK